MTNGPGRHSAESSEPGVADFSASEAAGIEYARPDGVDAGFETRAPEPPYLPPPPTVAPEDRAAYGRPDGAPEFAPPVGERLFPRMHEPVPVPGVVADAYGPTPSATSDGFDPPVGTRIGPGGREAESPWWKSDAARDPWRDPSSPFWLGRGAIFASGNLSQIPADDDEETDELALAEPEPEAEPEPKAARRARLGLSAVSLMIVVGLIAGGIGGGVGYWLTNRTDHLLHRSDVSIAKTGQPANRPPGSVADIARRVGPAVVSIAVTTPDEFAVGSGVVIDKNGYVLTNNHVIDVGTGVKATIVVTFADEATATAQVVGRDPISDLAVLKVPSTQLTVASLGDSDQLAVGDPVIAIGSPLGLQGTVTSGIVSALHRPFHPQSDNGTPAAYIDAIQTDAAINLGNSGGALVDASGAVIGINFAGEFGVTDPSGQTTPASGLGFAIPINYARSIATELIRTGKAVHASFGAQGRTVTANEGLTEGAYLSQITPNGPADKAGLKAGDVIVVANNTQIVSYDEFVVTVQALKPGDSMTVTYFRGALKRTATVKLGTA